MNVGIRTVPDTGIFNFFLVFPYIFDKSLKGHISISVPEDMSNKGVKYKYIKKIWDNITSKLKIITNYMRNTEWSSFYLPVEGNIFPLGTRNRSLAII